MAKWETVGFTGHRPGHMSPGLRNLSLAELPRVLAKIVPTRAVSGMALGFDLWAAQAVVEAGIDLVACLPFRGQEDRWSAPDRAAHARLVASAVEVVVVSEHKSASAYWARNRAILGRADVVVSAWNEKPGGGTYGTLCLAARAAVPVVLIREGRPTALVSGPALRAILAGPVRVPGAAGP
ncbi:MAG: SLOG family protein [Acidimicrobiales bacterium]